jgi:stage V sporulation protein AA
VSRLYLKPRRLVRAAPGRILSLEDMAELQADDGALLERAAATPAGRCPPAGFAVVPLLSLLTRARQAVPGADVHLVGSDDVVLEAVAPPSPWRWLAGAAAWLLLLVGAAVAMINFHADVNMPAAHQELYRLLTGRNAVRPAALEVPYAIGVGLGVLLFFHRPGRGRGAGEPSPLDLAVRAYEGSLSAYFRDNRGRRARRSG